MGTHARLLPDLPQPSEPAPADLPAKLYGKNTHLDSLIRETALALNG